MFLRTSRLDGNIPILQGLEAIAEILWNEGKSQEVHWDRLGTSMYIYLPDETVEFNMLADEVVRFVDYVRLDFWSRKPDQTILKKALMYAYGWTDVQWLVTGISTRSLAEMFELMERWDRQRHLRPSFHFKQLREAVRTKTA